MKKVLKTLALTLPLLAAIGIELVVSIFVVIVYYQTYINAKLFSGLIFGDESSSLMDIVENLPVPSNAIIEYIYYIMQIMWMILFYFWYRKLKQGNVERRKELWKAKSIALIAVLGIGYNLATSGLLELILPHFEEVLEKYTELMETIFTGSPILVFISVVIFAPVAEELIFRGVVFQKALKFAPFIIANIMQALLFGIFHMNLVQGIYAFAGGLALGYVAYRFKTIWASIIFHALYNGLGYLMSTPITNWLMIIYVIIGLLLVTVSIFLLERSGTKQAADAMSNDLTGN